MDLKKGVEIYARVKADEDEYKDQLLANLSRDKDGRLNIKLNLILEEKPLKDILNEIGVDCI